MGKNSSYIISYENKAWVQLIGLIGYISYLLLLVSKKFTVIQHVPKTWGLAEYTGFFKNSSSLAELEAIRYDWKQFVLVHIDEDEVESSVSSNYLVWINGGLFELLEGLGIQGPMIVSKVEPFITREPKKKRVSNEKKL